MKKIGIAIRAFFSLGWLGLVIFLLALAMLFAAFSQSSAPFDAALERMNILDKLEAEVALDLAEMQTQESLEIFSSSYGLTSSGAFDFSQQANERITRTLAQLEEDGRFYGDDEAYASDLSEDVAVFNASRAEHRQSFEYFVQNSDAMDDESLFELFYDLEDENESLNFMLRSMIISLEQDRQAALADFPEDANASILIIVISLAATLLLALVGYQVIAVTVRPLRHLRNMITTIGGDVYRPGGHLAGGAAGNLAKALEDLALAEQARNQEAKRQIEDLRQALYESRRRRLKIYQPGQKME